MSLNKTASRATPKISRAIAAMLFMAAAGPVFGSSAIASSALGLGTVFTADELGKSISSVDLESGSVKKTDIPLTPHNVDVSAEAGLVFVVGVGSRPGAVADGNSGSMANMAMDEEGSGLLAVFKLGAIDNGPTALIDAGDHPAHVVPDRGGKRVFVTDAGTNRVLVIDVASGKLVKEIGTGRYPHGQRLSPDGSQLFVADVEEGAVSVIDTATLTETARIPVGKAPVQVGFTPDGTRVYVSLRDENKVAVIDRIAQKVVATVDVGRNPIQVFVTPDGRFVYVADQGSDDNPDNRVSIIDATSNAVVKTLTVGKGAHGVTVSPDGKFVFVTNTKDNSLSVIDSANQTVVDTVPVGEGPNGIAIVGGNS